MAKKSILQFQEMKRAGTKFVSLGVYEYAMARFAEQAGIDLIEIGDSLGIGVYGYDGTLPVTVDQSIAHCAAVRRGAPNTFIVADMPFMSYRTPEEAVINAGRFYREAGVDAVTMEGGRNITDAVRAVVKAGMLVIGNIGLPETDVVQVPPGRYKDQCRTAVGAKDLIEDIRALVEAGICMVTLGPAPKEVAEFITKDIPVPTLGIGAGSFCDGQILLASDVIGMTDVILPCFSKRYANVDAIATEAIKRYVADVRGGVFPTKEFSDNMLPGEAEKMFKEYVR